MGAQAQSQQQGIGVRQSGTNSTAGFQAIKPGTFDTKRGGPSSVHRLSRGSEFGENLNNKPRALQDKTGGGHEKKLFVPHKAYQHLSNVLEEAQQSSTGFKQQTYEYPDKGLLDGLNTTGNNQYKSLTNPQLLQKPNSFGQAPNYGRKATIMCAEINGGNNNIPQNTSTVISSNPESQVETSFEEGANISTNDSDDAAQLAMIMNGNELDLLKDLDDIQKRLRVKYPSLKLYAKGPWLLEKIIKSEAATISKSIDIVFDCIIKDQFKRADLEDEISKMSTYGFNLKIVKKQEVWDVDFPIDTMWYDIGDGQLVESEKNWKSLKTIDEEPQTNADYRNDPKKSFEQKQNREKMTEYGHILKELPPMPRRKVIQGVRQLQLHYTYPDIFKKPEIKPVIPLYLLNETTHNTLRNAEDDDDGESFAQECRMSKEATQIVDSMFLREPQDDVNVASFVKDIAKAGYHPIFYTNIGEFQAKPADGPYVIGKREDPKTGDIIPLEKMNSRFFLGTTEAPAQTRKNDWHEGESLDYFQSLKIDQGAKVLEVFEILLKEAQMPVLYESKDISTIQKQCFYGALQMPFKQTVLSVGVDRYRDSLPQNYYEVDRLNHIEQNNIINILLMVSHMQSGSSLFGDDAATQEQKTEFFELLDKAVSRVEDGDVLVSMCAKIAASEDYVKAKLNNFNYKNENENGFKVGQEMVEPDLEKNQFGEKQDELLNATIDKDYLNKEILPKYEKMMDDYKAHMVEKDITQLDSEEHLKYILDEYQLEEGDPIKIAELHEDMKLHLAGQSKYLEEVHDYYHWYVWMNGAYGWL